MPWTVEVTYASGAVKLLSCVTREDARACRRRMLAWAEVVKATVR